MARNITAAQLDGEIRAVLAYPRREKPDVERWLEGWLRDNPDVSRGPGGRYVEEYAKAIRERFKIHHATRENPASRSPSRKTPAARLSREIDEALNRRRRGGEISRAPRSSRAVKAAGRAHATAPDASIWAEVGLEDASDREKAAFWREQLLNDVDELDGGVASALRPVFADVSELIDPEVLRAFARDDLESVSTSDYRRAVREIREQILNASAGQIVRYAEDHYRSLP